MREITTWEVVWSKKEEPIIVYRSEGVFKLFKTKIEDIFLLTEPIKGSNGGETYKKVREILCEKYDLDSSACDKIRALYHRIFGRG